MGWIVAAVAIVAVGGVVVYALANNAGNNSSPVKTTNTSSATPDTNKNKTDTANSSEQPAGATIVFTDQGFEKSSYTVKKGQRVEVKNQSKTQLEFSSDNHPTHTGEPELNLSVLQPGESASFTPTEVGKHGFHDHLQAQFTGTLTVTE